MSGTQKPKYPPEIADHYVLHDTIGSGGFAKVKIGKHKLSEEKVAIKIMDKAHLMETKDLHRAALEIAALKDLHHQNISQMYQVVETEDRYYIVLEYASGGELFDHIVARERCKEQEARVFFRQIVAAVGYCHSKGIAHRDLKPENLLLDSNRNIKLIDFGLISRPSNLHLDLLSTCCGSAAYAAPELIRGEKYHGEAADVWSLGILLYALLCGFLPFDDENTQKLYRLIQRGTYEIPPWLSAESQALIAALLKHNPQERLTIDQLLAHPWMLKGLKDDKIDFRSTIEDNYVNLNHVVVEEMAKYYGVTRDEMNGMIKKWAYDEISASYLLLSLRSSKGKSIRLPANKSHLPPQAAMALLNTHPTTISITDESSPNDADPSLLHASSSFGGSMDSLPVQPMGARTRAVTYLPSPGKAPPQFGSHVEGLNMLGRDDELAIDKTMLTRTASNPDLPSPMRLPLQEEAPVPSPVKERKPQDGSKGSLRGSFRQLAQSMMSLFGSSHSLSTPRKVKGLFNVNTTSTKEPREVLSEVLRVLREKNFEIKDKGFVVKARLHEGGDPNGKITVAMTFEICQVARMDLTGIRLTRIKGDTWLFKRVTQELLADMKL